MFASAKNGNVLVFVLKRVKAKKREARSLKKSFKKNLKKVLLEWKKGFIFAPAFGRKLKKKILKSSLTY